MEIALGEPRGELRHQRGNGRRRHQVLAGRSFGDGSTEPSGELADREPRLRSETKLFRPALDLSLAPRGDDPAVVDDDDPVGQALHLVELVAREDDAHAVGAQAGDDVAHCDTTRRIDSGGRLVQEGDAGLSDECQRQREPLLFSARQALVRRPRNRRSPTRSMSSSGSRGSS